MSTPESTPTSGNVIPAIDYSKLRIGIRTVDDAILSLGDYKKLNPNMTKDNIQRAITTNNVTAIRDASEFFFKISGIYQRLCKHLANLYRYDWVITPFQMSDKVTVDKVVERVLSIYND